MSFERQDSGAPVTVRYHRSEVDEIIQSVQDGVYCAVLGPRLSGKTVLLRYVEDFLRRELGLTCVYIDLMEIHSSTLSGFFAGLISLTAGRLSESTGERVTTPDESLASSAVFRGFLTDTLTLLDRDIVLIIEHLETVPADLVQALLTSLRAAYMDQQTMQHRLTVVVSGALSLATLTVGESSPFRGITRRVFIGDFSEDASHSMIDEYLSNGRVSATRKARARLMESTSGDHFLIRTICQRCVELARPASSPRLRARVVNRVVRKFLRREMFEYAPLHEAVRLVEKDPDLLRCMLLLLEHSAVPKADLPLPLSPDLDPLYLTGVVEVVDGNCYRLQNQIYRSFLEAHFAPGRVGRMLAMAGRWDTAIDYLETGINLGDDDSLSDLLPASINAIYAAEDLGAAAHFLVRGLSGVFGVQESSVWYRTPGEKHLVLVGGSAEDVGSRREAVIPITQDCLEARAYRQEVSLRGEGGGHLISRAVPLLVAGGKPVGVVTMCDELVRGRLVEQRRRDLRLEGYLTQAARALRAVGARRQEMALAGRLQASLLPRKLTELSGWELAHTWLPARETSGDYYDFIPLPGERFGFVIADVVDKGLGAALFMALSRTLIRTYAADNPDMPDMALKAVNERILADADINQFVTVFYGVLDPATGKLSYCNAGHNPPYLFSAQGDGTPETLERTGMALGVSEDEGWRSENTQIPPGGVLLLFTDGLVDAQNLDGEAFGEARMLANLYASLGRSAEEIHAALLRELFEFSADAPVVDDVTLVVLKRTEDGERETGDA